jgi:hypothetical protein
MHWVLRGDELEIGRPPLAVLGEGALKAGITSSGSLTVSLCQPTPSAISGQKGRETKDNGQNGKLAPCVKGEFSKLDDQDIFGIGHGAPRSKIINAR